MSDGAALGPIRGGSFSVREALEIIRALPGPCSVGFTGTQVGMTTSQYYWAGFVVGLLWPKMGELHEGDCVGADEQFTRLVRHRRADLFVPAIHSHPSNMDARRAHVPADVVHPPLPPLERNHVIVEAAHVLVAVPKEREEKLRSGTWATVRYARQLGRPIIYIYP